jgi:hypothetical protein
MPKHQNGSFCPSCEEKLLQARPYLIQWFRRQKIAFPNLHISWSYRDKNSQEQAYAQGKTHAHYPQSPHNRVNPDTNNPESDALDLFFLTDHKKADFSENEYEKIFQNCLKYEDEIIWGGKFKSLGDFDHFQFNPHKYI